jgi:hypothetical protein
MGNGHENIAATRLRQMHQHFLQRPVTGPDGHSYISSEPRGTRTDGGAPVNLRVVDQITDSVNEVVHHVEAVNPAAEPRPSQIDAVYDWYIANTENATDAQVQRRATVVFRQALEFAITMGDTGVIPPHRCPACRTFGLRWDHGRERAVCTHTRCRDEDGMTNAWTLAQLAYHHVVGQKNSRQVRAT